MFKKSIVFILLLVLLTNLATASTKEAAVQMTTTLENSQTNPAWNYAENIGDGRGITFGCIGFCTGTYDGNILIKYYTSLNPDNPLAKYIPALDKIDAGPHTAAGGDGNPSTAGLDGFIKDVQNCDNPLFKTAQLYELDQLYWNPAQEQFKKLGYKYALTQALLYDASVRLGPYGMQSLVKKSTASDEIQFCKNFISQYTSVLKNEGLGDTSRMTGFTQVLNSGNYNLVTPYTFTAYGDKFTITGDLGLDNTGSGGTGVNEDDNTEVGEGGNTDPIPDPEPVVIESKPHAEYIYSTSGKTIKFIDKSTDNPTSWYWDFGDRKKSTEQNPVHEYKKTGRYTVKLTVKNDAGKSTTYKTVIVKSR